MFGRYDFLDRREERSRHKELLEAMERKSYNEYQHGQAAGLKEGEAIGYEKGMIDGKKRGIDICLEILENHYKKPEDLAEEFHISIDIINRILQLSEKKG